MCDCFGRSKSHHQHRVSSSGPTPAPTPFPHNGGAPAGNRHSQAVIRRSLDRYTFVSNLPPSKGSEVKQMIDKHTKEAVAVKFINRYDAHSLDKSTENEIMNHRRLLHPNILRFKEVILTNTHLAIVTEFASAGPLFDRVAAAGRLSEAEARKYFVELISGVDYCHKKGIFHRDLKLENLLLDARDNLKISDFQSSKEMVFDTVAKTKVGSASYTPPEVLLGMAIGTSYNGEILDIWSCGVILYVMVVGVYPFDDPQNPKSIKNALQRILKVQYEFPPSVPLSREIKDLLSRIFVPDPAARIGLDGIKQHPWLRMGPQPGGLSAAVNEYGSTLQAEHEVEELVKTARTFSRKI